MKMKEFGPPAQGASVATPRSANAYAYLSIHPGPVIAGDQFLKHLTRVYISHRVK